MTNHLDIWQSFIEHSRDGIVLVNESGSIEEWNSAEELITGIPRKSALGKPLWEIQHRVLPEEKRKVEHEDRTKDIFFQFLDSGPPEGLEIEEEIQRPDGGRRFVQSSVFLVETPPGKMIAVIQRDITGLREVENSLKESEEIFRKYFELGLVGMAIENADGEWVKVNEKFCEIYGYTCDELMKKNWKELTYPADLWKDRLEYRELRQGKRDNYSLEKRYIHKDGRTIHCIVSIGCSRKADGAVAYLYILVVDITALRQTEEQLRDSEYRYHTLFDQAADTIVLIDAETARVEQFNTKAYENLGYTREEFARLKISDYDIIESEQDVIERIRGIAEKGAMVFETRQKTKSGELRDIQINARAIQLGGKKYLQSIWRDITEFKQIDRMKDEFIGMVSHEIKTPLTVIIGALFTATMPGLPQDQANAMIRDAIEYSDILADIVDNLLELSRSQSNRLVLQRETADIGEIAGRVVAALKSRSTGHHLVLEIPPELPNPSIDPLRAERVLHNLVENAIKYSPEGGEVAIRAFKRGEEILVSVSDQGIGISEEDQARLFQRFQRLDGATGAIKGIGLGLNVCRILAKPTEAKSG